jgi:drug/metabolite transporter (DMT)-like permease
MRKAGIIYLSIATVTYGALQVVDKLALNAGVDPSSYTIARVFIAMVFLAVFITFQSRKNLVRVFRKDHLKDLAIIGILASGWGLLLQIVGLSLTTATNTSIILAFVAPLTSFFAYFLLKEVLPKMFLLASALMIMGSLVVLYKPISPINLGDILVLLAAVGYAFSNAYAKKSMGRIQTSLITFGRLFFGSLSIALVIPFLGLGFATLLKAPGWVVLGGLIFAIRMVTYFKGIEIEGASIAATFLLFSPAVTVMLATLMLGETLTVTVLIGLVIVLTGGLLLTSMKAKAEPLKL